MFFVLGLSISLAALLVLSSSASIVSFLLWKLFKAHISRWSSTRQVQTLFLLRTAPVVLGIGGTVFLFAPAYLRYEPRVGHEDVSVKLGMLAALSAIGISVALIRGLANWRATRRLTTQWLSHAEPIKLSKMNVPAYQVAHTFPLIAVVGVFRPRLFIAKQVVESLTPAELEAALEHETGHLMAHDNLKRAIVRACRDLALVPGGKLLDRAWLEASEAAADEFAASRDRRFGLDLAAALLKIARMIPPGARPAMLAGAFLTNDESDPGVKDRVRYLVRLSDQLHERPVPGARNSQFSKLIPIALCLLLFALTTSMQVLPTVHSVIEHAVYFLD